jgi:dihydrofolate reductase
MIRHIVAIDQKRGIAKDGIQPWKLPKEEQYFADMTKTHGGVILMGRTTFEVIGRALPGRQNLVASKEPNFTAEGVTVVHNIDGFLQNQPEVWLIGGAQIYAATLLLADELYVTEIEADFGCDVFYPEFTDHFKLSQQSEPQQENGLIYRYNVYRPRP